MIKPEEVSMFIVLIIWALCMFGFVLAVPVLIVGVWFGWW